MKYLTKEGMKKLQEELEHRKINLRREISLEIKEAKEQGDLSENAEYTEAKRKQRENETRIMQLENLIRTSKVADEQGPSGVARIGSEVKVKVGSKEQDFEIVGANEASPKEGKISNESPIGQALLGKKSGEKFEVKLPNGKQVEYQVIQVQ